MNSKGIVQCFKDEVILIELLYSIDGPIDASCESFMVMNENIVLACTTITLQGDRNNPNRVIPWFVDVEKQWDCLLSSLYNPSKKNNQWAHNVGTSFFFNYI